MKVFRGKLKLLFRLLSQTITTHFAILATTAQPMMSTEMYANMIFALDYEFGYHCVWTFKNLVLNLILYHHRLQPTLKNTWCYTAGTDWYVVWLYPPREIIYWKYGQTFCVIEYNQICQREKLVLFGSSYICEQTF